MPLSLSDSQLKSVTEAASLLSPLLRDNFLRSVASVLGSNTRPTDGEVQRALRFVLSQRGVAVGRQYYSRRHPEAARHDSKEARRS